MKVLNVARCEVSQSTVENVLRLVCLLLLPVTSLLQFRSQNNWQASLLSARPMKYLKLRSKLIINGGGNLSFV